MYILIRSILRFVILLSIYSVEEALIESLLRKDK